MKCESSEPPDTEIEVALVTNTNVRDQVVLFTFTQNGSLFWTVIGLEQQGQEGNAVFDAGFTIDPNATVEVSLEWLSGAQVIVTELAVESAVIEPAPGVVKLAAEAGAGADGNVIFAEIESGSLISRDDSFDKPFDDADDDVLSVAPDSGGNDVLVWSIDDFDSGSDETPLILGGDGVDMLSIGGGGKLIVVADLIAMNGGQPLGIEIFDLGIDLPNDEPTENDLVLSNLDFADLGLVGELSKVAVLGDGGDSLTLRDLTSDDDKTWQKVDSEAPGFDT